MFARGFQPGGYVNQGPGSSPKNIIQGSFPFQMGQTLGEEIKQGFQPGYLSNVMSSGVGSAYENLGNIQNYFLSPYFDLGKKAINELGTGFLGMPRGEFTPTRRVVTSSNPYGLPVNLFNEIDSNTFNSYYPVGTKVREAKVSEIYSKGGSEYLRNTLGVTAQELRDMGLVKLPDSPPPGTSTVGTYESSFDDLLNSEMILAQATQEELANANVSTNASTVTQETKDIVEGNTNYPNTPPPGMEVQSNSDPVTNMEEEKDNDQKNQDKEMSDDIFLSEVEKLKQELKSVTGPENSTDAALLLLKLGSNLMSGKTSEKGLSGFLDVLGQASGPVVDTAIALAEKRRDADRELGLTAAGMVENRMQKALDRQFSLLEVQAKNMGDLGDNYFYYPIEYDMNPKSPTYGEPLAYSNQGERITNPKDVLGYKGATYTFEYQNADGTTTVVEKPAYDVTDVAPYERKYSWAGLMDPEGDKWKLDQARLGKIKSSIGKIDQVTAMFGDGNEIGFFYNPKAAAYTIGTIWNQLKGKYADAGKNLPDISSQEIELAYNTIANDPSLGDEERAIALQNLEQIVTGKGVYGDQNYFNNDSYVSYQDTLAQYLNAELNDKLNVAGGMSINDIKIDSKAGYVIGQLPGVGNQQAKDISEIRNKLYSGTYFDVNSGKQVPYDGDDTIGEIADSKFEYLSDIAEKYGLVYDTTTRQFTPGYTSLTAPGADRSITVNLGGREVVIPSSIAAVDIYSTILGFDFARYIQPEQRLLKDTIESSVGKFDMTGQLSSPQVLLSRIRGFKNQLIQEYNETIDQNFLPDYRLRHYYQTTGYLPTTGYDMANPGMRYDGQIESSVVGSNAAMDSENLLKFYDIDVDLNLNPVEGAKLP